MNARLFRYASVGAMLALSLGSAFPTGAETIGPIDFESFSIGTVNAQFGWSSTGPYDHKIVDSTPYAVPGFGSRSLRISNASASGNFGDHTFSVSLANEAGETTARNDGFSGGMRQSRFDASWEFGSTVPLSEQPGLSVVASPNRGDLGRMSWIQMKDTPTGLEINFNDYQDQPPYGSIVNPGYGCGASGGGADDFVQTTIATGLDRTMKHSVRIVMDFVDGPRNDVVNVYVDGVLKHTGTSWEDYFVYCAESAEGRSLPDASRTVDSILFRTSVAAPGTLGFGFLVDNLSMTSGPTPPAELYIAPKDQTVASGSPFDVQLGINNAMGLYGYELTLSHNPSMATGVGTRSYLTTFFTPDFIALAPGACTSGACAFGASLQGSSPAVNGSGDLAQVDFVAGTPGVYTLSYALATNLSAKYAVPIPSVQGTAMVTVTGKAFINGNVKLQGRATPMDPGIITLHDMSGYFTPDVTGAFDAAGNYSIEVPAMPAPGGTKYRITADHDLYLYNVTDSASDVTVVAGGTTTASPTTLQAGDATNDNVNVDIGDLTCIATYFGGPAPANCGGGSLAGSNPDLNKDTKVNIFDLVLAASNFGQNSPQQWWP